MQNFQLPSTWDGVFLGSLVALGREGLSPGWGRAQPAAYPHHHCQTEPPAPHALASSAENELMGQPSPLQHDLTWGLTAPWLQHVGKCEHLPLLLIFKVTAAKTTPDDYQGSGMVWWTERQRPSPGLAVIYSKEFPIPRPDFPTWSQ